MFMMSDNNNDNRNYYSNPGRIAKRDLIEGVGDEVLFATLALTLTATLCLLFSVKKRSRNIHPSNQDAVASARERLNIIFSNRFFDPSSSDNNSTQNNHDNPGNDASDTQVRPQIPLPNHYGMDNQCPVCLNEPRLPVETNCGHLFCAQCLIVYWRHGNWSTSGPIRCPVCRQQVSVMLTCFRPESSTSREVDESVVRQILRDIHDYNRRYSGAPRPYLDYLRDLPTLLRHLSSEFFTLGGLMYMLRIRIVLCFVAAIMYLISPLDMIPEAVFGLLGLLDDVFVVILLAVYVTIIYRRFLATRWTQDNFNDDEDDED